MSLFGSRRAPAQAVTKVREEATAVPAQDAPRAAPEPRAVASAEDRARLETVWNRWHAKLTQNSDLIVAGATPDGAAGRVREALQQIAANDQANLQKTDRERLIDSITAEVVGFGPLEELLAQDDISEIMVNTAGSIYIERGGRMVKTDLTFRSEESLVRICRKMAQAVGRTVDTQNPMCDARLLDGSRINIIVPPLAVDGTHLTIRKFKKDKLVLSDLVKFGALTEEAAEVLRIIGRVRINLIISGGTGSGKTTLLNCLTGSIDQNERVITCEDTAELQLQQPHVVRLETRPAGSEGTGAVTMQDLVRNALRMKPHRIIVGEVRDSAAIDLVQAMNTGHMGSMGTIHANDPRGGLARLEALIRTGPGYQTLPSTIIRKDIADSVDLIIQTQQLSTTGKRVITHITEIGGMETESIVTQDLFKYDFKANVLKGMGVLRPRFMDRAAQYGEQENLQRALEQASGAHL